MSQPEILSEDATLDLALAGVSLARYGDGELKLATGGNCVSQVYEAALAAELREILTGGSWPERFLACLPNIAASPRESWKSYAVGKYSELYGGRSYGSAFITRPDSAPWIDRPDYWAKVRALWEDKDVTLVVGTDRSLRVTMLEGARSVRVVRDEISHRDAYARIDAIEAEIGTPPGPVLLCLGATATVLAWRLARKGVHALDLGHIGMFMRHAGAYAVAGDDLISPGYRQQLLALRRRQRWGGDGAKHAEAVRAYAAEVQAETILDYGCGEQALAAALKPIRVMGYDPGIPERAALPKPCELVVCTDVLEHVEPERLDAVLGHIFRVAGRAAYMVIATRSAKTILPDGRNAHLIVEPADWWRGQVARSGWTILRSEERPGREVRLWLSK